MAEHVEDDDARVEGVLKTILYWINTVMWKESPLSETVLWWGIIRIGNKNYIRFEVLTAMKRMTVILCSLGGYHITYKQRFLPKLWLQNVEKHGKLRDW